MAYLRKRKTANNESVWYVEFQYEGRRIRKSLKTCSKTIAQKALNKYRVLEDEGNLGIIINQKKPISLGEFLKTHLTHAERTLSPSWYHNKCLLFERYLVPFFGANTLLKNITKGKIEDYQNERLKTVSNRTVNIETNCLMTLLRHAIDRDELELQALPRIKKLPEIKGRLRYLEVEEIRELRRAAENHSPEMNVYVMLMLFAGLRSGEALSVRWEDLDLERRILHVAPREDWSPKNKTARIVPVPNELNDLLKSRRKELTDPLWIVDGCHSPYMLKRGFQKVVKNTGLSVTEDKKVTAHTLRHTYASHLVMNGTPLYTVSALLGHSDTKTTEIYAHLAPDHLHSAVQNIEY